MTTRQLPPELVNEIFSNLTSSPPDLYHCLLASRTFYVLVKPSLYFHITITSNEDCKLLRQVKEEDKQLVKKVTILGNGTYRPDSDDYDEELRGLLASCVRDLLAVIETLVIRSFGENPISSFAPQVFKVASKLRELSIQAHGGGGNIWLPYFETKTNLPVLCCLAFTGVSSYHRKEDDSVEGYPSDGDGFGIYELLVSLPISFPYTQLEVLVAKPPSNLEDFQDFPFNNFLALLDPPPYPSLTTLPRIVKNCGMINCPPVILSRDLTAVKNVRPKSNNPDNVLHFFFFGRRCDSWNSQRNQDVVAQIQSADIIVHEGNQADEEEEINSNSLIFTSFVKYLEKCKTSS